MNLIPHFKTLQTELVVNVSVDLVGSNGEHCWFCISGSTRIRL